MGGRTAVCSFFPSIPLRDQRLDRGRKKEGGKKENGCAGLSRSSPIPADLRDRAFRKKGGGSRRDSSAMDGLLLVTTLSRAPMSNVGKKKKKRGTRSTSRLTNRPPQRHAAQRKSVARQKRKKREGSASCNPRCRAGDREKERGREEGGNERQALLSAASCQFFSYAGKTNGPCGKKKRSGTLGHVSRVRSQTDIDLIRKPGKGKKKKGKKEGGGRRRKTVTTGSSPQFPWFLSMSALSRGKSSPKFPQEGGGGEGGLTAQLPNDRAAGRGAMKEKEKGERGEKSAASDGSPPRIAPVLSQRLHFVYLLLSRYSFRKRRGGREGKLRNCTFYEFASILCVEFQEKGKRGGNERAAGIGCSMILPYLPREKKGGEEDQTPT